MTPGTRLTYTSALILQSLAAGYRYGFDIMEVAGLASGTVYPALRRLEKNGLVEAHWEDRQLSREKGRPRRRYYRITLLGQGALARSRKRYRLIELLQPRPGDEPAGA